jgi:hypothetical protein
MQLFEPVVWTEEILPPVADTDLAHLPRLYSALALSCYIGKADAASAWADQAIALQTDPRYDPFDAAWATFVAAVAHLIADGDLDRFVSDCADLAHRTGLAHVIGLTMQLYLLTAAGRGDDARAIAAEAVTIARAHGNPVWIVFAHIGTGRAFAPTDPSRARDAYRSALDVAQTQPMSWFEARIAYQSASLETAGGDIDRSATVRHRNRRLPPGR